MSSPEPPGRAGGTRDEGAERMRRATGARVEARGLGLRTGRGPVYQDVDLDAAPGSLTAVRAERGCGRTSLLLTLAGRMRPTSGSLRVDGHALPHRARLVRRIAALGVSEGVNDLDDRLRVREHLRERLHLRMRPARGALTGAALESAGLAESDGRRLVRDLSTLERRRLGVALALLEEPRLLLVDDLDLGLGPDHQRDLWRTLRDLADDGPTVVTACADTTASEDVAPAVVELRRPPARTADEETAAAEDTEPLEPLPSHRAPSHYVPAHRAPSRGLLSLSLRGRSHPREEGSAPPVPTPRRGEGRLPDHAPLRPPRPRGGHVRTLQPDTGPRPPRHARPDTEPVEEGR
ncbi:ATP-binding cassette domain-containing protein [Marinactinospora thermotolerans]|uniref:ABC transporter ATP-binding protein n=1 Tax=Marinactinospora thermotolerans TaxID=531310 RepID=UPI003D8BAAF6